MHRLGRLSCTTSLRGSLSGRRLSISASGEKRKHYERRLLKFSPAHVYGVVTRRITRSLYHGAYLRGNR